MRTFKITQQITPRETESLGKYFQEISKVELLSADEEFQLVILVKQGDKEALDKLIKANLRFVVSVAKQYQNQFLTLSDLINEGNLGLIKAAKKFDESRGFRFISYAVWWIRQSIIHALAEHSRIVRLPFAKIMSINRINTINAQFEQKFERQPNVEELADLIGIKEYEVNEYARISKLHISLDAPLVHDEKTTMNELIKSFDSFTPESIFIDESLKKNIEQAVSSLSIREADIVKLYFGLHDQPPMTLNEIGEKHNLTRERVRQIKDNAITQLKKHPLIMT